MLNKLDLFFIHEDLDYCYWEQIPFYPTTSNFIITVMNKVHMYFDAKKAGHYFISKQTSITS